MSTSPGLVNSDNNTCMIDSENAAEQARLMLQDRILTASTGELFPKEISLVGIHDVLDIACGPGGWVLNVAYMYPKIHVMGIDISRTMIEYARARARTQNLRNTIFSEGNVMAPLDIPDNAFDFVNARFLHTFMPRTAWPSFIEECWRILRPGGILCMIEANDFGFTNSPAYTRLSEIAIDAMYRLGYSFSTGHSFGLTPQLSLYLRTSGFIDVKHKAHLLDFSAGTELADACYQNFMVAFNLLQPFLLRAGVVTQTEIDSLYQQALLEFMLENHCAHWFYASLWGQKPKS